MSFEHDNSFDFLPLQFCQRNTDTYSINNLLFKYSVSGSLLQKNTTKGINIFATLAQILQSPL